MATLASLKLTTTRKPGQLSPAQIRRNKLVKRIGEQIQLAQAQQNGTTLNITRSRTVKNAETGERRTVEQVKRLKPWWFQTDNGKLALNIRYGARVIDLAKGKSAVEIASVADLVPTLELIRSAVDAGELDTALEAASGALREGFKR